jgi:Carboxypeptidase regulatory-like domain
MRFRPINLICSALFLAIVLANELSAQTTTSGGLTGVVTDRSGAVVPNALVEVRDDAKGTTQSTSTDQDGVYRFFFLAPSRYLLTVTHDGFQKESRIVQVLVGPPGSVNVTLEIARANTTLTVTSEAPLIQTENGDFSTTMNQQQISEVPNPGNDLTYIAQTAPGMVMNVENQFGANFSSLGMPGTSNLFTIDGLNQNDNGANIPLVGATFLLLGQNQIQEATVVSIGYSGQFGGAAGANVNYVTKSGSNAFHGNAQYYWNGRVLNANDWFNNEFGEPRPFDVANQWAGSLGGPIKKDKLFFFFDTEGQRLLIPQQFFVTIPSPQFEAATLTNIETRFGYGSASYVFYRQIFNLYNAASGASAATPGGFSSSDPTGCTGFTGPNRLGTTEPCAMHFISQRGRPTSDSLFSGRVDWIPGKDDRAFLKVQSDIGHNWFYLDPINPIFDAGHQQSWWQGQIVENHTFSSSAANQFLLTGMYFTDTNELENPSKALATFPTSLNFNTTNTFTGIGAWNSLAFPTGRPTTQYQISEDFVKNWSRHKVGVGVSFERIDWTNIAYTFNAVGTLTPQTLDAFYQGGVDPTSPRTNFTELSQSFPSATSERIAFYTLGLYGQDEWHALPSLTMTLALRAEHYSNPVCRDDCFARMLDPFNSVSHDPDQPYNEAILIHQKRAYESMDDILWSPRFSFAWQPLGVVHNTVIRGGFGIFYDPVPGTVAATLTSNPPLSNSYTIVGDNLAPNEQTSLFKDAAASDAAFLNGFASGQTLAQIQASISSFYPPGFSPPAITVPPARMHFPQYQRWSLELQQAFGAGTSVDIGYFGNHGIHELVQNPSANAYGFGSLPASLCASPPVPPCADPRFSEVTQISTDAVSNYNGMVVSFQHQFSGWGRGLFEANYTYSHAFDEVSNGGLFSFTYGSALYPQDPNNLSGAYGPAEYDVRHSFNANYVWEVPVKAVLRGHGPDPLVKGWQVSGTVFARTGFPYTAFDFYESGLLAPNNYFGAIYAVPVNAFLSGNSCGASAATPLAPNPCQPPQGLANGSPNPKANFVQAGCETGFDAGNLPGPSGPCSGAAVSFAQGRNRFRGPDYFNTDFAIMKNTKIPRWENATLGIGFQFFNLFNHPNFSLPDNGLSNRTFGQILSLEQPPTGILGAGLGGDVAPRMIQLKVQLRF